MHTYKSMNSYAYRARKEKNNFSGFTVLFSLSSQIEMIAIHAQ